MDYSRIYNDLVGRTSERVGGYTEVHHITPKCMGGSNSKENLVRLTAREHYLAHWLLYKIHGADKLAFAWNMMCMKNKNQLARYTSHSYKYAREASAKATSAAMKGNTYMLGKKLSEETKRKMSKAQTGKKVSDGTRLKQSLVNTGKGNPNYGKTPTDETRVKLSKAKSGTNNAMFGKTGINSPLFKGWYITPTGAFCNLRYASEVIGLSVMTVLNRCKRIKGLIRNGTRDYPDAKGKTWEELGWSFRSNRFSG